SNVLDLYKYNKNTKIEILTGEKFPASAFQGKNQYGTWLHGKIFIKGIHYYLVYQAGPDSSLVYDDFFKSFFLGDFVYINPIKEITDNQLGFKALDEVTEDAASRFSEKFNKAFEAVQKKTDTL